MKTKIFFFTMLANITTSAQVTHVEPVGANYANKTVSFRVWWNAGSRDATHLAKVWVWVDYIQINSNNTTSGNTWTRATVGTITGGVTSFDGSNRKGFWLEGNASTNYSATLTVQLTNVPDKFNWCVFTSDYPPNMVMDKQTYYFKGTQPFLLKEANGTPHEITQTSMPKSSLTFTPVSITDKTECPGGLKEVIGSCPYTGTDWYADPNHKCQLRTTGAKNWEAWIKDTRDNELYRIVLMPDNKWWLAQNVKLAKYGQTNIGIQNGQCDKDECGRFYKRTEAIGAWGGTSGLGANKQGICPSGWILPTIYQYQAMYNTIKSNITFTSYGDPQICYGFYLIDAIVAERTNALNNNCTKGNDYYGFATKKSIFICGEGESCDAWIAATIEDQFIYLVRPCHRTCSGRGNNAEINFAWGGYYNQNENAYSSVRCFRQP